MTRLNTNFTGGSIDLDIIIKKEADQKVKETLGKHNIEEVETVCSFLRPCNMMRMLDFHAVQE